jgi:hypothetical protein
VSSGPSGTYAVNDGRFGIVYVFGSRDVSFVKVRTRALGVVRETKKQKKTVSKNLYARAVSKNRAIEKDLLAVVSQRDTFGSRPGCGIAPDRDAPEPSARRADASARTRSS